MKLEPVYLVAPRPRITTRRAFVFAVGSAIGGVAVGFAGGWLSRGWLANGEASAPPPATADPRIAALISWAKDIAARDDERELRAELGGFLAAVRQATLVGADTPELWRVVEHGAQLLVSDPAIPQRRALANSMLTCLDARPTNAPLDPTILEALQRIAR